MNEVVLDTTPSPAELGVVGNIGCSEPDLELPQQPLVGLDMIGRLLTPGGQSSSSKQDCQETMAEHNLQLYDVERLDSRALKRCE